MIRTALRAVRFVAGLAVLFLFQWVGTRVVSFAHVPIPGSVAGMALLALCIRIHVVPLMLVRPAAEFLVRHLAVLYVPAGVALVLYVALLRDQWVAVAAAGVLSLVAVLLTVGTVVQRLERTS